MRRADAVPYGLVAAAIVAGVGLRGWVLTSPLGALDADEASVGLMARHIGAGELPIFVWGQPYGGTQEAGLTTVAFWLAGIGTLQLKLVECFLFAAGTVVVWYAGVHALGRRPATLAALLLWIWPGFLVFWSTKANGYYGFSFLCVAIALLLVFRLDERDSRRDAVLLGVVLGQGMWASLEVVAIVAPFVVWLVARRPAVFRSAWVSVPAFLVSFSPVLVWNAGHGWATFSADPHVRATTFVQRFEEFFTIVLPSWFGVRTPYSLEWVAGSVIGSALLVAAALAVLVVSVKRELTVGPLLLCCAAFPLFYALSPFAGYVTAPKYLVLLAPVLSLLAGAILAQHRLLPAVLVLALAASIGSLVKMERWNLFAWRAPDVPVPTSIQPLLAKLDHLHATRVVADQALAPRITFESKERIVATGGWARYRPHQALVLAEPFPARVFLRGARTLTESEAALLEDGYRRHTAGAFVIFARPPTALK